MAIRISREDVQRVLRATRQVERQMRNPRSYRGRWQGNDAAGGGVRCTALLKGALAGEATCTVDNVEAICGTSPTASAGEELTPVYNPHAFEGPDNGECRFEWHATRKRWELYQCDCDV